MSNQEEEIPNFLFEYLRDYQKKILTYLIDKELLKLMSTIMLDEDFDEDFRYI